MLQATTIQFLKNLKQNNNKPWFDANRKPYEAARQDFLAFINAVIRQFSSQEPQLAPVQAKDCVFRINRDIRFSKDKSPYKTNFGASINIGGKKSVLAGYYFHLEPGESFVGGGLWIPAPEQLARVRQEIDYNFTEFKNIVTSKPFVRAYGGLFVESGQQLTRVPKGYAADNPAAGYLKLKSFIAQAPLPDNEITGKGLIKKVNQSFSALKPVVDFLNVAVSDF